MLKLIGAGLILASAIIFGIQLKQRLAQHLLHLIGLKEILLMLAGEMTYAKTPLTEAFRNIAARGKEPFGSLLNEVADRIEKERELPLADIWKSSLARHKNAFVFSKEEVSIFSGLGDNFGYLDIQMQLNHLTLYIEQIETKIQQAKQELSVKQKMYQYLSIMSGLFLILLLL